MKKTLCLLTTILLFALIISAYAQLCIETQYTWDEMISWEGIGERTKVDEKYYETFLANPHANSEILKVKFRWYYDRWRGRTVDEITEYFRDGSSPKIYEKIEDTYCFRLKK